MCDSGIVRGKNQKNMWWDDNVKVAVRRKQAAWKVMGVGAEDERERCLEVYKEEKKDKYV